MPDSEPDFRLASFEAATDDVAEGFWQHIEIEQDMLHVLAEHHAADGTHSFYVLYNSAATYGCPTEPQIVALHLIRDQDTRTYRFEHEQLPLPAMAQSWLIARGCPEKDILLAEGRGGEPADKATRTLESRLRHDGDHFAFLGSNTDDTSDTHETTVMLRAIDPKAPTPYRVVVEEMDTTTWTYTLRESAFATFDAASQWWEARLRGENLPPPPAVSKSCDAAVSTVPGLPARPASPSGPGR